MKLIDLLVQELPKRGGWKFGRNAVYQDWDGEMRVDSEYGSSTKLFLPLSDIFRERAKMKRSLPDDAFVNLDQYEAALAASKQPAWSGEGLPPVGIKCLTIGAHGDDSWYECTILAHTEFSGKPVAVFQYGDTISHSSAKWFKPLPTEAERKREGICDSIFGAMSKAERKENRSDMAEAVYDAITAGKIPGVKLVD